MDLAAAMQTLLEDYGKRKAGREVRDLRVEGRDPWTICVQFLLQNRLRCEVRPLRPGDVPALEQFGLSLSERSRSLFSCHPWLDPAVRKITLQTAIDNAINKVDASYLLRIDDAPAGFFFLWKAGHNAHSAAQGLQIPELGIAISDPFHGLGLGGLLMRFLQQIARTLDADAVELTTGLTNEEGYRTYCNVGFELVGVIPNPLHVDVAAFAAGEVQSGSYRLERQMVWLLKSARRQAILDYMAAKRRHLEKLCAGLERDTYED